MNPEKTKKSKRVAEESKSRHGDQDFVILVLVYIQEMCSGGKLNIDPVEALEEYAPKVFKIPTKKLSGEELAILQEYNYHEAPAAQIYLDLIYRLFGKYSNDHQTDSDLERDDPPVDENLMKELGGSLQDCLQTMDSGPTVQPGDRITHMFTIIE